MPGVEVDILTEMMKELLAERSQRNDESDARTKDWAAAQQAGTRQEEIVAQPKKKVARKSSVQQVDERANATGGRRPRFTMDAGNVTQARTSEEFQRHLATDPDDDEPVRYQKTPPDLPAFTGLAKEWPPFIVNYVETTRKLKVSDLDNLARLRKALSGEALRAVGGELIYASQIGHALDQLRISFGDPAKILAHLEQEVTEVPKLDQNGQGLQELAVKARSLVTALHACGMENQMCNQSLVNALQGKLCFPLALRWSDYTGRVHKGIDIFSEFLSYELENALFAGQNQVRLVRPTAKKTVLCSAVSVEDNSTANSTKNTAVAQTKKTSQSCVKCSDAHVLSACPKFKKMKADDRLELASANGICWNCLRSHPPRSCGHRKQCDEQGCNYMHHPMLHDALTRKFADKSPPPQMNATTLLPGEGLFKYLPVTLRCGELELTVFAFIDEGSAVSLIDSDLAAQLRATGPSSPLTLRWYSDQTQTESDSQQISVELVGEGGTSFIMRRVRTISHLDLPEQSLDEDTVSVLFPNGGGPAPYRDARPRMMIGIAHAHLAAPIEMREDEDSNLLAARTRLGWVMYGGDSACEVAGLHARVCHMTADESALEKLGKEFYDTESFGVRAAPVKLGRDDERALAILKTTTKWSDGRYESGLLWANDHPELPASRNMCFQRASTTRKKMAASPTCAAALQTIIDDYLKKGYCIDVTDQPPQSPTWYLPVFPVTNKNKPGKTRLVWDAAAKVGGRSLNSFLLTGPDLLNPLPSVLMRFRERRVAVTTDVCEMFHQIRIRAEDRDAQRFLWWPANEANPREYRMEVMTFGSASSPTTAQYVQRQNAELFRDEYPDGVNEILTNYYVDDMLSSFDDDQTATRVIREVIAIQRRAGFDLKKWRCSSPGVLSSVHEVGEDDKSLASCDKVLGMIWNCKDDTLRFATQAVQEMRSYEPLTRRKILSGTMALFDPLGMAARTVVKGKMIVRSCLKLGWDEEVSTDTRRRWMDWCDELEKLNGLSIPRFHDILSTDDCELHTFVDASEIAFAAVTFLRGVNSDGETRTSLVMAKSRVAPLGGLTMPRMELQAAVMGVRLADTVTDSTRMTIRRRIFWSDSMDVICWIRSHHRRYKSFVAARINEIMATTKEPEWRWVPSAENVADDATRPSSPTDNPRWFSGPQFLQHEESEWPKEPQHDQQPKEELLPVMKVKVVSLGLIPDVTRFHRWQHLVNSTALALRVLSNAKKGADRTSGQLTTNELLRAEEELFRAAQMDAYSDVVGGLTKDSLFSLPKKHTLYKLNPLLDDKRLLRVNGRLPRALFPVEVRQPIILPSSSRIVLLLVMKTHQKLMHGNHETVISELRKEYYIPGLRRLVRQVAKKCLFCQIDRPRISPPLMGNLPEARAAIGWRPFTYCGIDYFGPFEVVILRRRLKRWVALFTCMTTRAVHLEVAHSMDTSSCIMCVRMMMARRDVQPIEMRSDCGTNFTGANVELKRLKESFPGMKWIFNSPASPHMGGAWERLVGVVKRCLKTVIGDNDLTDETLRCALAEVEWVVNARPLTHIPADPEDEETLTPNHFLHGASRRRHHNGIGCLYEDHRLSRKSWRDSQRIADHFWKRFAEEVLPELNLRTKWYQRAEPLKEGDVVMVADEGWRGRWRRGIVVEAPTAKDDDQVRQVRVATAAGEIMRPAVKVAKVDV